VTLKRRILTVAIVAAALSLLGGLSPTAPASAQSPAEGQWRERLIGEFVAAISGRGAPDDVCLSLYLNGKSIYNSGGAASFTPASLMKLATATVALKLMGPDATYTTEVVVDTDALKTVSGGVLQGDLYLIGGGDPTLATLSYAATVGIPQPYTDVNDLADAVMVALRARGISVINGSVVGDESRYPESERDYVGHTVDGTPVWKASYRVTNLSGPLSALMINDGYHPHRRSRRSHVRPVDVARAAAAEFDDLLEERGLVIRRSPRSQTAPAAADRASLASLKSIPMSQIVKRILTSSNNTTSEMVFKEIGYRIGGSTRAEAATAATAILRGMVGDAAASLRWVDGSGLSTLNKMSCDLAVRLITEASVDSVLLEALAVAGETGTLRYCGPAPATNSNPRNTVRAKTGALNNTDALAGIALAPNGDVVAFAMIASEDLIILRGSCNPQRRALISAAANYNYGMPQSSGNDSSTDPSKDSAPDPTAGSALLPMLPAPSVTDFLNSAADEAAAGVHQPAVRELVEAGVALACDDELRLFCPDMPIPRAEVAWYLAQQLQLQAAASVDRFSDVAADHPFAAPVAALANAGVTQGCGSGERFCPEQPLTRAQMASFLVRAFDLSLDLPIDPATGSDGEPEGESFSDVSPASPHAAAITALAHAGITKGCESSTAKFCPDRLITRAEFATFLSRAQIR